MSRRARIEARARFLRYPPKLDASKKYIPGSYRKEMRPDTGQRLARYFRPHNRRLYGWLGVPLGRLTVLAVLRPAEPVRKRLGTRRSGKLPVAAEETSSEGAFEER